MSKDDLIKYCGLGTLYSGPAMRDGKIVGSVVALNHSATETAAEYAGIQDGDILLAMKPSGSEEWQPLDSFSSYGNLAGAPGTRYSLRLERDGKMIEKEIVREFVVPLSPEEKARLESGELEITSEDIRHAPTDNGCVGPMSELESETELGDLTPLRLQHSPKQPDSGSKTIS